MIYVLDDFLDQELFKILKKGATKFVKKDFNAGDENSKHKRTFWVKPPSKAFNDLMVNKLSEIEGGQVINILSFFREARKNQDNEWRIHNDLAINGQQPDKAIVFHIKCPKQKGINGTALWEHKKHGDIYKGKISKLNHIPTLKNIKDEKEFHRLLKKDANNRDKWILKSVIGAKPNRLLSYPSEYFHSKYPEEFVGQRVVFVMFYKIKY
tara:strand:- start:286 stop:915 length:630 start_codon:yes stop_codon:yes gene_type:complete